MEVAKKILEEAKTLFMQYGLKTVSMDDIAKGAGVSKKTIYQHFKDKTEIISEVVAVHFADETQFIIDATSGTDNCIEELYEMSKCMRKQIESVNPAMIYDMQRFYPAAYARFEAFKNDFVLKLIRNSLKRGMDEGYFRADLDIDIIAILRMEQIQMIFNPEIFPKESYNFQDIHQQLFTHYAMGLLTDNGRVLFKHYFDEEQEA